MAVVKVASHVSIQSSWRAGKAKGNGRNNSDYQASCAMMHQSMTQLANSYSAVDTGEMVRSQECSR